jgi:CelD/BcsL family acetyltransferase involved in cellulose biosynthesis
LGASVAGTVFQQDFWLYSWWQHFGRRSYSLLLFRGISGDTLIGVVPLVRSGVTLRRWSAPYNSHLPVVGFACQEVTSEVFGPLLEKLALHGDCLDLGAVPSDGPVHRAISDAARERSCGVVNQSIGGLAVVDLASGWKQFESCLSRNLAHNIERVERQLRRSGHLEFRELTDPHEIHEAFPGCLDLEAHTWKGTEGTAIASQTGTLGFYCDVVARGAERGLIALYTLRHDGRLIAFDLCAKWGEYIHALKTGYEAQLSKYSPGQLLRYLVLEKEFRDQRFRWYDMGLECGWKSRWTQTIFPLTRVRIYFPHIRGRVALTFGPRLREIVKGVPVLHSTVRAHRRWRAARVQERRRMLKIKATREAP